MTSQEKDDLRVRDACFKNVLALYSAIQDSRSAIMKNGKNTDALDFCADVIIKARRAVLDPSDLRQFEELLKTNPSNYTSVPQFVRAELGRCFIKAGMGLTGTYRKLYFRIKSQT
jgi:hypothetical protein